MKTFKFDQEQIELICESLNNSKISIMELKMDKPEWSQSYDDHIKIYNDLLNNINNQYKSQ